MRIKVRVEIQCKLEKNQSGISFRGTTVAPHSAHSLEHIHDFPNAVQSEEVDTGDQARNVFSANLDLCGETDDVNLVGWCNVLLHLVICENTGRKGGRALSTTGG